MCTPITFHGITPAVFATLKDKLRAAGITVRDGNLGVISEDYIKANFAYWEMLGRLEVTITSKPFLVSCGYITGKIYDEIVAAGGE